MYMFFEVIYLSYESIDKLFKVLITVILFQMLNERARMSGPALSVIVVIAPGSAEHSQELDQVVEQAAEENMRIATITYPAQLRARPLDWLANNTGGVAYTVTESKYNMATSFLSTYFKLTNVMWSLVENFYQGDIADLPIEVSLAH